MIAQRGHIILTQAATVMPGGTMFLVVSGDNYNNDQPGLRLVVQVVGPQLRPAAGAYLYDLGTVGTAVLVAPTTLPSDWLTGEPIAVIGQDTMDDIATRIARLYL
ncbi:hypothetical protein IU501_22445 [Nocardia otitidiscaviarum]|uniref:hypothetical protein n=1 Tax=Nocardia otitidiscaviarum TaxID=1823 RepID=UPI0004A756A1|nr:hypothetical protein [Nocardia otitidiscaviarum]MBF6135754.1 hypothetical protein [Nocardia otitidiscaviarum]MBF6483567.1 hypothetical protein [Nocardia otitidiscaviarum]